MLSVNMDSPHLHFPWFCAVLNDFEDLESCPCLYLLAIPFFLVAWCLLTGLLRVCRLIVSAVKCSCRKWGFSTAFRSPLRTFILKCTACLLILTFKTRCSGMCKVLLLFSCYCTFPKRSFYRVKCIVIFWVYKDDYKYVNTEMLLVLVMLLFSVLTSQFDILSE